MHTMSKRSYTGVTYLRVDENVSLSKLEDTPYVLGLMIGRNIMRPWLQ